MKCRKKIFLARLCGFNITGGAISGQLLLRADRMNTSIGEGRFLVMQWCNANFYTVVSKL